MSSGERSPKRQRLESYSPGSPSFVAETKVSVPLPPTPSSVRMSSASPSWTQSQNITARSPGTGSNFPTPTSTAGFQTQSGGRDAGGDSARHTPASESDNPTRRGIDEDAEMTDRNENMEADSSAVETDYRRSDHEREEADLGDMSKWTPAAQAIYKRSTAPIPPSRPDQSQNMIRLYDLERIQASVARRDPVTGEKTNKLRKSYENKLKTLGLEGRNKPTITEGILLGCVDGMWDQPVPDGSGFTFWTARQQVRLEQGLALDDSASQDALFSKLESALTFSSARLPKPKFEGDPKDWPKDHRTFGHKEWQQYLGLDDPIVAAKAQAIAPAKQLAGAQNAVANTAPAVAARGSAPASPQNGVGRPGRTGAKRRYDDSSFEGYTGYDTDGRDESGRRGSNAKRQKRKDFPASSQNPATFTEKPSTSNNPNMVGVRSS